jgi:large subunit ribosomal protein L13
MNTTTPRVHTIDATGKRLGTVATEAAHILQGKDQPDFVRHLVAPVIVEIHNASKLDIPEGKKSEIYQSYSGYPGGHREETLDHLGKRLGYGEVLRRTIGGMLPGNKLKKPTIKNLVITE